MIKDCCLNYEAWNNDFTLDLGFSDKIAYHGQHSEVSWKVAVADTGAEAMTGGRVKRGERYAVGKRFIVTYGDGLADVDVRALLEFYKSHGKLATVTAVRPLSRFGVIDSVPDGTVVQF